MPAREALRRAELVAVGAALERQGLVRGGEGNFSCRLDGEVILLTPRGARKGRLAPAGLLRVELGQPLPTQVSSEAALHVEVYRRLAWVGAVVHAHPPATLALSCAWSAQPVPEAAMLAEGVALLEGGVGVVPPFPPGSHQLAAAVAAVLGTSPVAVLVGHGAVAVGSTPMAALERLEILELLARLELARRGPTPFSP